MYTANTSMSAASYQIFDDKDMRQNVHCPLCDYSMLYPKKGSRSRALIFLDIDGVLINHRSCEVRDQVDATSKLLFPKSKRFTEYQQIISSSRHFDQNALANLNKITQAISESGQCPLIILSSAWRHALWLNQLCKDAYAQYEFSQYLCGKTPIESRTEKHLAPECKMGFKFYRPAEEAYGIKLDNRGSAIEFWLIDHHFDKATTNFIVLDDEHQRHLSRFGPKFIETCYTLSEENAQAAIDVLCKKTSSANNTVQGSPPLEVAKNLT